MQKKKTGKQSKRIFMDLFMMVILLIGLSTLLYPFVSDAINTFLDQQLITYYQKQATKENEAEILAAKEKMVQENKKLAEDGSNPGADPFSAEEQEKKETVVSESYFKKHTIGVISIPKINIELPIFDQTEEVFLSKGAALLAGTSYPIGGESTHAVISAHRGLAKAKLFTDLPQIELNDNFFIEVNNEIHAYEVDQIKVIEPTETGDLHIITGEDYITLLTCTPYMVNSHRLLVRGHRVPYVAEKMDTERKASENYRKLRQIGIVISLFLLLILLVLLFFQWIKKNVLLHKSYSLTFRYYENEQPVVGEVFQLYSRNGQHRILRDGKSLQGTTDESGIFLIQDVRGGKYLLKQEASPLTIKASIKKIKQPNFSIELSKKVATWKIDQGKWGEVPIIRCLKK